MVIQCDGQDVEAEEIKADLVEDGKVVYKLPDGGRVRVIPRVTRMFRFRDNNGEWRYMAQCEVGFHSSFTN